MATLGPDLGRRGHREAEEHQGRPDRADEHAVRLCEDFQAEAEGAAAHAGAGGRPPGQMIAEDLEKTRACHGRSNCGR